MVKEYKELDHKFKDEIKSKPGGENLSLCFSCGSCTATCPVSEEEEDFNPRLIIKKALLGFKEELLSELTIWQCIQCRRCVSACPQNVRFADIIRVLREMAVEAGYYSEELEAELDKFDRSLVSYRLKSLEKVESGKSTWEAETPDSGGV
ncbi:MAG: 4Fe-4S dicluster domain-containing protein [Bacillota bacterium]